MYASVVETTMAADKRDEALAVAADLMDQLSAKVEGMQSYVVLDLGGNKSMSVLLYDTKENFEAATEASQEILSKLGPYLVDAKGRIGCDVVLSKRYVTD